MAIQSYVLLKFLITLISNSGMNLFGLSTYSTPFFIFFFLKLFLSQFIDLLNLLCLSLPFLQTIIQNNIYFTSNSNDFK